MLMKMYNSGMSVARLNGSHNTLEWHSKLLGLLRVIPDCPILLDVPGKKLEQLN